MGIDVGTGGSRRFIFDIDGRKISTSYEEWRYVYPPDIPYGVEFDPETLGIEMFVYPWTEREPATCLF